MINKNRTSEIRVIGSNGENLGIMSYQEAQSRAREKGLDLVEITRKATPPVYKITDKGKYLYQQKKKEKRSSQKTSETKEIRLTFAISEHDLAMRAKQADRFLNQGNRVRVMMRLRGRENALRDFAKQKVQRFLDLLKTGYKIERELKNERGGMAMMIIKK